MTASAQIGNRPVNHVDHDYRLRYVDELCDVIEKVFCDIENTNESVYTRDNIDYIPAIKLQNYQRLRSDESIYRTYAKSKKSEANLRVTVVNNDERRIIGEVIPNCQTIRVNSADEDQSKAGLFQNVLEYSGYYGIRRKLCEAQTKKRIKLVTRGITREWIFFVVVHDKFIRYSMPIMKRIETPVLLICNYHTSIQQDSLPDNVSIFNVLEYTDATYFITHTNEDKIGKLYGGLVNVGYLFDLLLTLTSPTKVVHFEGSSPVDRLMNATCDKHQIESICIQHGWNPMATTQWRNLRHHRMLMWGDGFIDALLPRNPVPRFISVGNHVLNKPALSKPQPDREDVIFMLQGVSIIISPEQWREFLDLVVWTASNFENRKVLVREHPGHPLSDNHIQILAELPNVELVPPTEYTLDETLRHAFLSVTIYSSTIFESIAMGIIPLIFNNTPMKRFNPDLASLKMAIEVNSFDKATNEIHRLLTDSVYRSRIIKNILKSQNVFCSAYGESALQNIVDEIMN